MTAKSLKGRATLLALLLGGELVAASLAFDGESLRTVPGVLPGFLHTWGATVLRFVVGVAGVLATFSFLTLRAEFVRVSAKFPPVPVRWNWLVLHVLSAALCARAGISLYWDQPVGWNADILALVLFASAALAIVAVFLSVAPLETWIALLRVPGSLWGYSTVMVFLALAMLRAAQHLWEPASRTTFVLVQWMLRPFFTDLLIDPSRLRVATDRFGVIISPECSGLEGIGLMLLFGGLWLWLFRKECRFPQALLLLPASLLVLFLLNSARIAVLLVIGHLGAREIALGGFHSQAGWVSFNAVAFGFCVVARRLPYVTRTKPVHIEVAETRAMNAVTPYLVPFLAVLASGMIAASMTGGFAWLYPLRFFAGLAALFVYRNTYFAWDWKFGWQGILCGAAVFLLWIGTGQYLSTAPDLPMPLALQNAVPEVRWMWIGIRFLSAATVIPLVEELAFRGCLLRVFVQEDFEALPRTSFTALSLLATSLIFGGLHGSRWIEGVFAGLLYAAVYLRRGRLGEAVVAHSVTNALLGTYVLVRGAWQYW